MVGLGEIVELGLLLIPAVLIDGWRLCVSHSCPYRNRNRSAPDVRRHSMVLVAVSSLGPPLLIHLATDSGELAMTTL